MSIYLIMLLLEMRSLQRHLIGEDNRTAYLTAIDRL